jgi:excisionase family DNA binding protein
MEVSEKRSWLTTAEAAQVLGLSMRRVSELVRHGRLRATRIGERGRLRYARDDVEALIKSS